MAENEKKISQEFITNVKKYLEIDDLLKDIKEKTKKLTTDKKNHEEFILDYLKSITSSALDSSKSNVVEVTGKFVFKFFSS